MERSAFTKEESLGLKGIAILLMIFPHCFGAPWWYSEFSINFFPLLEARVNRIASFGGICVGIFAFITGYGLSAALERHKGSTTSFCFQRYIKSMHSFWPILVICLVAGVILDNHTAETYLTGGTLNWLYNLLIQGLGLSYLFGTPMFVHEWWYLSAMVIFIFLTPVLVTLIKQHGWIVTLLLWIAVPYFTGAGYGHPIYGFSIAVLLGVIFYYYRVFDRIEEFLSGRFTGTRGQILKSIAALCVVAFSYKVYVIGPGVAYDEVHAAFIPVIFIICFKECVLCYPLFRRVFAFLGKHSANMYFIHTVFSRLYLRTFLFSLPWFGLTLLAVVGTSLGFSVVLETGKRAWRKSASPGWSYDLLSRCRGELMGISLLLVLLFHAVNLGAPLTRFVTLWANGFLGVDVFILLSAMGLTISLSSRKQRLREFYMRRCIRILPAFWIVTGSYGLLLRMEGKIGFRGILQTMSTLAFWTGKSDYFNWYIPALLMFYLMIPFCYMLFKRTKYRVFLALMGSIAAVALSSALNHCRMDLNSFVYRIPVFLLGIVIGLYYTEKRPLTMLELSLWGLGLIAAPVVSNLLAQKGYFLPMVYSFALYVVFMCLFVSRMVLILPEVIRKLLRVMGSASLEIYLLNVVFVLIHSQLSAFLNMDPFQVGYYMLIIPANIVLGIGFHKLLEPFVKYLSSLLCPVLTR